jgi:hypothetical protein
MAIVWRLYGERDGIRPLLGSQGRTGTRLLGDRLQLLLNPPAIDVELGALVREPGVITPVQPGGASVRNFQEITCKFNVKWVGTLRKRQAKAVARTPWPLELSPDANLHSDACSLRLFEFEACGCESNGSAQSSAAESAQRARAQGMCSWIRCGAAGVAGPLALHCWSLGLACAVDCLHCWAGQ